jgi:hypothetical protein
MVLAPATGKPAVPPPVRIEFFEARIRPVLAEQCYRCHNSSKIAEGGLAVDDRAALLRGGDRGVILVPGKPGESRLLAILRHEIEGLKMPQGGAKLDKSVIADFEKWIEQGAHDPRDKPPSEADLTRETSWEVVRERRKQWWSLQPVRRVAPPAVKRVDWSDHPVDRFVLAKLEEHGLRPSEPSDRRALLRRATFALTGLPPTPDETKAFLEDHSSRAYEKVVDRLLESPRFGERWARHWMDLVRYCESHGSQGDPELLNAWRYRDYLIRAFNGDLPYDQLLREHLAGDLLPQPRIKLDEELNESALGIAHLRMNETGQMPVDALDDQVKVVDNQIDVFSKAFQGLTVSCARCHDHKFDAISQKDYYALYGVFASCRPGQVLVDTPERIAKNRNELVRLKERIRVGLAEEWKSVVPQVLVRMKQQPQRELQREPLLRREQKLLEDIAAFFPADLAGTTRETLLKTLTPEAAKRVSKLYDEQAELSRKLKSLEDPSDKWNPAFADARKNPANPLHAWSRLSSLSSKQVPSAWSQLISECNNELVSRRTFNQRHFQPAWDLTRGDLAKWNASGAGLSGRSSLDGPLSPAGQFCVESEGDRILQGIYPASVLTHGLTRKHNGVLTSPRFVITTNSVSLRAFGKHTTARLVIENYALDSGELYPATRLARDEMSWTRLDSAYRKGAHAYVEFISAENELAYFGAGQIVFHDGKDPPREVVIPIRHLLEAGAPATVDELGERYADRLLGAIEAFRANRMTEDEVAFLDFFVRGELLPVSVKQLPKVSGIVEEYRQREREVPKPRRSPGVHEATAFNQPLFVRGRHTQPAEPVARRFLEALGGTPYQGSQSGRLQLANEVASPDNPLTARVMVNRLWHHLFGKGLVGTVDNFGRLGDKPTHPELLDYLAARFVAEEKWSIKKMLRLLMTSRAYQQSSQVAESSRQLDGNNDWLSHMPIRRLEAEAIRDAILAASGQLDLTMYGPGINVYFVNKTEGGGLRGPLDGNRRRSVYQRIRRNAHNPFLEVFDAPKPSSTRGKRDVTNVPAQSLALLNDPFVIDQSAKWGAAIVRDGASLKQRVCRMFVVAFGREPDTAELEASFVYLTELAAEHRIVPADLMKGVAVWQDFAHSIFCMKEFVYVR